MTNLGKGIRKGLKDGLCGTSSGWIIIAPWMLESFFEVRELFARIPKVPEGGSDVAIRESPVELSLRAEEVNTSKAYIDVNHIESERWSPPLVNADWYAFYQALYKGIEGEDWEEMYDSYKVMSRAVGVKKPQGAKKAKALRAMTAAKDSKEELYGLARWSCGKNISRIQVLRWTKP